MKKILAITLLMGMLIALVPTRAQVSGSYFELYAPQTTYGVGQSFSVDILVHPNGEQLNVARAVIHFPQNIIRADDFDIGNDFPFLSPPGIELDNTNGIINVGAYILNGAVTTDALLGTLTFTAISDGTDTIDIAGGSHLISPDQVEKLNLMASIPIEIEAQPAPPQPNGPPQFISLGIQNVTAGNSVSFIVSASDPDGDTLTFSDIQLPPGAQFLISSETSTAEGTFTWTPPTVGTYQAVFTVSDDNSSPLTATQTVIIQVNTPTNTPPSFVPVGSRNVDIGETVNFNVAATDINGDQINLTWSLPNGSSFDSVVNNAPNVSGIFIWAPTQAGNYFATFMATDDTLYGPSTTTLTVPINVAVPGNTPPVIAPITEIIVNAGEVVSFDVQVTDAQGDLITLTADLPEGASFSQPDPAATVTGTVTWTPGESGLYWLLFTAQDDNQFTPLASQRSVRVSVFGGACPLISPASCGQFAETPACPEQYVIVDTPLEQLNCPIDLSTYEPVDTTYPLPVLTSKTHPDQRQWYANANPEFSWGTNPGVSGSSISIDQTAAGEPGFGVLPENIRSFSYSNLQSGVWYAHLRQKYAFGWSPTATVLVRIDVNPPIVLQPYIETQGVSDTEKEFYVQAPSEDTHSGIQAIQMDIDGNGWRQIELPYKLTQSDQRGTLLKIRVIDFAGNSTDRVLPLQDALTRAATAVPFVATKPVLPPILKEKVPEEFVGALISRKSLIFSGEGEPGAVITVYIQSANQYVDTVTVDKNGYWVYYLTEPLEQGEHVVWTTSTVNGVTSPPSEVVLFNLPQDFKTESRINREHLVYIIIALLMAIIAVSIHTIRLHAKLKKQI